MYSYVEATTIKITVIVRKAFGGAYIAMGSKALGIDAVCALPNAQIGVMGVDSAIVMLHRKEIDAIEDDKQKEKYIREFKEEYSKKITAKDGIDQGYIDETVEPDALRQWLGNKLIVLQGRNTDSGIFKKHGNIPL